MQTQEQLSNEKILEIVSKGWMTHDAMWFFNCLRELGIEQTNRLNKASISMLAVIEIKRMLKAFNMQDVAFDSFEKVWTFFDGVRGIAIPDWMDYSFEAVGNDSIRWRWNKCFAYQGVVRIGAIDDYQCGVMYRIECWLKELRLNYEMIPKIEGCLMHQTGECTGLMSFHFPKK